MVDQYPVAVELDLCPPLRSNDCTYLEISGSLPCESDHVRHTYLRWITHEKNVVLPHFSSPTNSTLIDSGSIRINLYKKRRHRGYERDRSVRCASSRVDKRWAKHTAAAVLSAPYFFLQCHPSTTTTTIPHQNLCLYCY